MCTENKQQTIMIRNNQGKQIEKEKKITYLLFSKGKKIGYINKSAKDEITRFLLLLLLRVAFATVMKRLHTQRNRDHFDRRVLSAAVLLQVVAVVDGRMSSVFLERR